jgi:TonB family protein
MTPFILYQIKAGLCIMLFTGFYFLFLRKETFYAGNRVYLVISVILSAILPLIRLPILPAQNGTLLYGMDTITNGDTTLVKAELPAQQIPVLKIIYLVMVALLLCHLFYQFFRLMMIVRKNGSIRLGKFIVISLPIKSHSFSFFNLIFIASPTPQEGENDQVLQHEMVHARQLHSLDILLIQLFKIFQWFNPFIYLTEKAMQETHEYLADEAVMEQYSDSGRYRLLLLTQVFGVQPGIFSLFNYSLIKNRLVMMTKQKSPHRAQLKYLVILPLIAVILLLNCTNKEAEETLSQENDKVWVGTPPPPTGNITPDQANAGIDPSKITDEDTTFIMVDQQALFQGGDLENFRDWVQKNVKYPESEIKKGNSGRVTVQFAVNSKGKVSMVKILKGVSPAIDEEVARVIAFSDDWTPASYKGYPVKQQFVMPVVFQLESNVKSTENKDEPAFIFVEKQAAFQGGSLETFRDWVQQNLKYPEIAVKNGIFGRVTIQFAVNSDGKVCDIKILRGVAPSLDEEAVRTLQSSPLWTPAEQGGKPVKQQFVMPVIFSLK